jgi:hypothetical protein
MDKSKTDKPKTKKPGQSKRPIEPKDSSAVQTKKKMEDTVSQKAEGITPVIVEAGSRSKKSIRELKEGTGTLMHEVNDIIQETRSNPDVPAGSPIVILYREKSSRKKGLGIPTPLDLFR